MQKPQPTPTRVEANSADYEQKHVHEVYEQIADHFSQTRYKPWPVVEKFLLARSVGQVGADVGCGNGKYLGVNKTICTLGSDRSANLIRIVNARSYEGMVCDMLHLPYRSNRFDYCLSIAAIHHLSTPERRIKAVEEILRILKPGGHFIIFVWALEQTKFTKRNFAPGEKDVFVPWVRGGGAAKPIEGAEEQQQQQVFQRYYHLFSEGELGDMVRQLPNVKVIEEGYDCDNWYVIGEKTP